MNDDSDTFIESVKLSACAVPPVPLLLPEVLSIGIKQEVGKQTLNGIQASPSNKLSNLYGKWGPTTRQ